MGNFEKVKLFLLNYKDILENKDWQALLEEANFVGLDNSDVHLMLEMFRKAKIPITDEDLKSYIEKKIKEAIDLWHKNRNFPHQSSSGKLMLGHYFEYNNIHRAGYSYDFIRALLKNYMAKKLGLYDEDYLV